MLHHFVSGISRYKTDHVAVDILAGIVMLPGGGDISDGGGYIAWSLELKGSYYFDRTGESHTLGASGVNLKTSLLFGNAIANLSSGKWIVLTVGHDGIVGRGIGIFWRAGMAYTSAQSIRWGDGFVPKKLPSFLPVVQPGLHFDFK